MAFLDKIISDSKNSNMRKRAAGSGTMVPNLELQYSKMSAKMPIEWLSVLWRDQLVCKPRPCRRSVRYMDETINRGKIPNDQISGETNETQLDFLKKQAVDHVCAKLRFRF